MGDYRPPRDVNAPLLYLALVPFQLLPQPASGQDAVIDQRPIFARGPSVEEDEQRHDEGLGIRQAEQASGLGCAGRPSIT